MGTGARRRHRNQRRTGRRCHAAAAGLERVLCWIAWRFRDGNRFQVDDAQLGLTYLYTDLGEHGFSDSYSVDTEAGGLSGSVDGEVDARFHSVRLSFDVLF
jgi:hypothetical protein